MGDIPFNDTTIPEQDNMSKAAQHEEAKKMKLAFNQRIQALHTTFQTEVNKIAQEFSRQGYHCSCHQIQKQVLYCVGMQKKPHKPAVHNTWTQAEAATEKLGSMCLFEAQKVPKNLVLSQQMPSHHCLIHKIISVYWRTSKHLSNLMKSTTKKSSLMVY